MTVKELMEKLQSYPPDMTVVIRDADTDWFLNVQYCQALDFHWRKLPVVVISGDYDDQY